jgi:hypothetical protein
MKKILVTLLVLLVIGAVGVVSCPDRQAHKDAIMAVVNDSVNEELQTDVEIAQGLSALVSSIGSGIMGYVLDKRLTVKNYFVCSIGEIKDFDGVDQIVSLGIFGHVFTLGKEDLKQVMKGED